MAKTNTKKYRGSRTCGGGTTKNRRGAGNRGGRGRSGENKHHFVRALQLGYTRGSNSGFSRPLKTLEDISLENVGELDELADRLVREEVATLEDDVYHINLLDFDVKKIKVLGKGKVTKRLNITASGFSALAREKIEAAGGTCVEVEE